jgi:putative phosphoribosyl transferase
VTHDPETPAHTLLPFADRDAAGDALALVLGEHPELTAQDPVVIALPRGGVPVAAPVARAIDAPLDVIIVRKLGAPGQPELAMGALGEGGTRVLEHEVLHAWHVSDEQLAAVEAREQAELARRAERLRAGRTRVSLQDRPVIVVDDGVATGSTARAAMRVARAEGATSVVLAVPVAPASTVAELAQVARGVVCVAMPSPFAAIGQWYRDFSPTTDAEVVRILDEFRR